MASDIAAPATNKLAKKILAYFCLAVGVAGLALPILPGIPLLIVGLALLGPEHPFRRLAARWKSRFRRNRS
ncbi:MAG TPA: hypothetical protein VN633_17420 [Bryobacteraceae bacterium]|nr:hypothetical protein [Bryobacteraceae bacterium]